MIFLPPAACAERNCTMLHTLSLKWLKPLFGWRSGGRGRLARRPVRFAAAACGIEILEYRRLLSVSAPGADQGHHVQSHKLAPLVVDVVTHGFNSSPAAGFTDLAKRLAELPAPHTKLDGRVGSEVFAWNSSSVSFETGLVAEFAAEVAGAELQLLPTRHLGKPKIQQRLAALTEQKTAFTEVAYASQLASDTDLNVAATNLVADMHARGLLDDSHKGSQQIELIGHSRGAGVNALVYGILREQGFKKIDYTALDGYASDWTYGGSSGGALSGVDIVSATAGSGGTRINCRAGRGLASDPFVLATVGSLVPADVLAVLQQKNQLRAPDRHGFKNVDLAGATHTTIYKNPFVRTIISNSYVAKHAHDAVSSRSAESHAAPVAPPSLPDLTGFVDGSVEGLGKLTSEVQSARATSTGVPFLDQEIRALANPLTLLNMYWQTTGDVTMVSQAGNTSLQLSRPASSSSPVLPTASISQTMVLPGRALSIDADLGIQSAAAGTALQVLFNGAVLSTIPLDTLPASSHISAPLAGVTAATGVVTFRLVSTGGATTTISLDNFSVGDSSVGE